MAWTTPATWATDEVPGSAKMNAQIRDNLDFILPDGPTMPSWTPTLQGVSANYDISGQTGRRARLGPFQFCWARFRFPAADEQSGSGVMFVTLPNPSSGIEGSTSAFFGQVIGSMHIKDASTGANSRGGTVALRATSPTHAHFLTADGTAINESSPFTFDDGDVLTIYVAYPIA